MTEKKQPWWKTAVVYQIYPKSFQDSNGDGIGDIQGIISRLDYLRELGVDALWISPMYCSPQDDNGYDISDYRNIDPMFGTMEDMEELIRESQKRDIRIVMDLVLNHTSDEHIWFQEAKKSKDNPYHDYYVWRDGKEGELPNDMRAVFGGPAWEWVPQLGQYYFHQFSVKQPDLNWENPKVRREIYDMILWWMEKGIGGFRLDVIDQIAKEPDKKITNNGPRLHDFLRELSKETFQKGELLTVGEAWGANTQNAKLYSNPDGSEFSMVFQFEHVELGSGIYGKWNDQPIDLIALKKVFKKWEEGLEGIGWNALFWSNHDQPRAVSRYGNDGEYREYSAKMLGVCLHLMKGTPYIYQGEELGMTNAGFTELSDYRDLESINAYHELVEVQGVDPEQMMRYLGKVSRDNARTPMQWNTEKNAGFTTGTPWIRVNENYKKINAAAQLKDPDSIYNFYRRLIQIRHEEEIVVSGSFEMLMEESRQIFAYQRVLDDKKLVVLCNFTPNHVAFDGVPKKAEIMIGNYKNEGGTYLRPYEAIAYKVEV